MAAQPETVLADRPPYQSGELLQLTSLAEPANYHPKKPGGSFFNAYVLPDYEAVSGDPDVILGAPVQQDEYGTTYIDSWTMNDSLGTRYKTMRAEASHPKSNVWIVKDTAWGTQPEGLNTDVARKLMSMGFNVLIKGPEIGSSIPLSQSAYNTHVVLDKLEQLGLLEARLIAVEGYSRGAMIAFGTVSYAKQFNRIVIYANITDPCVAVPIGFNKETWQKARALPKDLGMLAIDVGSIIGDPLRARHLYHTVDFSVAGIQQIWRTGKGVVTGETGAMAACTPSDMKAIVAFFKRCGMNDKEIFYQLLEGRPDVRFVEPGGGHGRGIDKKIIASIALPFGRLACELEEGRRPDELDYRFIIHGLKAA